MAATTFGWAWPRLHTAIPAAISRYFSVAVPDPCPEPRTRTRGNRLYVFMMYFPERLIISSVFISSIPICIINNPSELSQHSGRPRRRRKKAEQDAKIPRNEAYRDIRHRDERNKSQHRPMAFLRRVFFYRTISVPIPLSVNISRKNDMLEPAVHDMGLIWTPPRRAFQTAFTLETFPPSTIPFSSCEELDCTWC